MFLIINMSLLLCIKRACNRLYIIGIYRLH
uniref:Uncharacterized protein n=1 Tax=Myoviridae sp. ctsK93 TaxID=2825190 RepID=A0A8S5PKP0_9CAUD|nr:MAG TPA: hypothetical protein [Myoviridae sp. ctsK93]